MDIKLDMNSLWEQALYLSHSKGGYPEDYLQELVERDLKEIGKSKARKESIKVPETVAIRLDKVHQELVAALFEKDDYKTMSDLFRQSIRYMASRELSETEFMELMKRIVSE